MKPLSDRQILNWLSGKLNKRKGARFSLYLQDSRDMGVKKGRVSVLTGSTPDGEIDTGNTVRHALSAIIRREKAGQSKD